MISDTGYAITLAAGCFLSLPNVNFKEAKWTMFIVLSLRDNRPLQRRGLFSVCVGSNSPVMDLTVDVDGTIHERLLSADGTSLVQTARFMHPDGDLQRPFLYAVRVRPTATGMDMSSFLGRQTAAAMRPAMTSLGGTARIVLGADADDGPCKMQNAAALAPPPITAPILNVHAFQIYADALTDNDLMEVRSYITRQWQ